MGSHTGRGGSPGVRMKFGTRMKVTKTTMFFLGRLETFLHIHSVIKRDGTDWADGGTKGPGGLGTDMAGFRMG